MFCFFIRNFLKKFDSKNCPFDTLPNKMIEHRFVCILTVDLRRKNSKFDNFCWISPNLRTAMSNRNLIDDANLIIELAQGAHELYLRQTPQEKADLMKLVTIELLFDGENVAITIIQHSV